MKVNFLNDIVSDESGATAIEYGLIVALIAVVLIAALNTVEGSLTGLFNGIGGTLTDATPE